MRPTPRSSRGAIAHHRTLVDNKLMEKSGLDEVSLRRVRKAFMLRYKNLNYKERQALAEEGTCARFHLMDSVLRHHLGHWMWQRWLVYLEHTERDLEEMCRGEYPISPYLMRVYSALFGIKIDFLLLGDMPVRDRVGANIDVWPLTGTHP